MCELFISYSSELRMFHLPFAFLIPWYSSSWLISFEGNTKMSPCCILKVLAASLNKGLFKLQIAFVTIFITRKFDFPSATGDAKREMN